jgi:sec-independent protein translocase protein TatA
MQSGALSDRENARRYQVIEDLFKPEQLIILFVIVFFLFGAKRLPELGKSLGHGIREFRGGIAGLSDAEPEQLDKPAETPAAAASTVAATASSEAPVTTVEAAATTAGAPAPVASAEPAPADQVVAPAPAAPVDEVVDPGDVTVVDEPVDVTPIEADEANVVDDEAVAPVADERAVS